MLRNKVDLGTVYPNRKCFQKFLHKVYVHHKVFFCNQNDFSPRHTISIPSLILYQLPTTLKVYRMTIEAMGLFVRWKKAKLTPMHNTREFRMIYYVYYFWNILFIFRVTMRTFHPIKQWPENVEAFAFAPLLPLKVRSLTLISFNSAIAKV